MCLHLFGNMLHWLQQTERVILLTFPQNFYAATHEYNTYEKHVNAPYIRRTFTVGEVRKAELVVSALGFYELFLNGEKITKGLLAPYISNPDDIVYFDAYDVTALLHDGKNTVGLLLGNGMQNNPGGEVWDFQIASFRGAPRFALRLQCTLKDGEVYTLEADESFCTAPSPILFDDLRSGVFYDARLEQDGWCCPDFDESAWTPVYRTETPRGEFRLCEADPIVITKEIAPVEIREAKLCSLFDNRENMRKNTQFKFDFRGKTGVLFDFGVNTAGILRLRINGHAGQQIYMQMCEFVNSGGEASYQNINFYPDGYAQSDLYICKGEGEETFEPSFTYHGYRYVMVFGLTPEQVKRETLTMLVANSDLETRGAFSCSDETMNKLGEMARRSDLANFYYFPTDCPHREKNGWTGDAACSAEHMLLTLTPETSYREWLRNICKAQNDSGALPGIVPTGGWGFAWGNGPAWDNVLTELCWQVWRMRGDLTPAKECSASILRYLAYIDSRRRADGLVAVGLGDWLQPNRGAGSPVAPLYLTDSVITMYIAKKSADLFRALGKPLQTQFAETLYRSMREAIRKNCIDFATMTVRSRCQTAQAICLYYGVFDGGEKAEASRVLVQLIQEADGHIDCGMIGLRALFHVLSDCGQGELAYRMITRPDGPSYGAFLEQGLTSLPESLLPCDKWDYPDSLNHHFFGDIVSWFIQRVAGIRVNPDCASPDHIDITPDFLPSLSHAEANYTAPAGKVSVRWQKDGGKVALHIEAAEGIYGEIRLPAGYVFLDTAHPYDDLHRATVTSLRSADFTVERK